MDDNWRTPLVEWKGFWFPAIHIKDIMALDEKFNPLPSDIIIASFPKTGTTWLMSLSVAILNLHNNSDCGRHDPLRDYNPHELIPHLEIECYGDNVVVDPTTHNGRRVFHTHMPYSCLPQQMKKSSCRVIYISRNPADTFVSSWNFYNEALGENISFEDDFEAFCTGRFIYGSYFNHVLEYWKERDNENVLFLTYEELKEDPEKHVKRLADFLGCHLNAGEIEQVVSECRFDKLAVSSNNIERLHWNGLKYSSYFRKGLVGDWKNVLTPQMLETLVATAAHHWDGTGLEFRPTGN